MASRNIEAGILIKAATLGDDKIAAMSREVERLAEGAGEATPEFAALGEELAKLAGQQALSGQFVELKKETLAYESAARAAQAATAESARALREKRAELGSATAAEKAAAVALGQTRATHAELAAAVKAAKSELQLLRQAAKEGGDSAGEYAQKLAEGKAQLAALKAEAKTAAASVAELRTAHRGTSAAVKEAAAAERDAEKAFERARTEAGFAKIAYEKKREALHKTREALKAAGVASADLADAQRALGSGADAAEAKLTQLAQSMREMGQIAADRDALGVRAHQAVQQEIDETRAAYERLKASGTLTNAELAQAALKTEERIRELRVQTNGWSEALVQARSAFAGLAASGAGVVAVAREAIQFESAMANVAKVVDGTEAQVAALSSRLRELATEIPIGAEGLAQIAAAGGQLGVPIEKLEQFISLAARMATAFGISAEAAGQAVAKLANVFGLPIEQVEKLGDAINVLGNTTAAVEADIVDVLTRIGGTAKQFGLTAEQASALAASMLSLGVSSEVAGTGINALLAKLQTANVQGEDFQRALREMGVSAQQLAADIRANPQQALTEFLRTLDTLDAQSRAETLSRLFGQEYQDDIARLLAGLADYEKALGRVTDSAKSAGAMQSEFETRLQTTEAQLTLLKNGVETLAINLGNILLPVLRPIITSLGDAAGAAAKFAEEFPAIAGVAGALVTAAASANALRLAWLAMSVAGVQATTALRTAVVALNIDLATLAGTAGALAASIKTAGAVAASGWIGWNIGSYLRDEFLAVEQAGVALAAGLTKTAARAQAAWEMIKAPFTDDTIEAAYERLQSRLVEIDGIYAEIFAEAGRAKDAQVQAGDAAAAAAGETAAAAATAQGAVEAATGSVEKLRATMDDLDGAGLVALARDWVGLAQASDAAITGMQVALDEVASSLDRLNGGQLGQFVEQVSIAFSAGKLSAIDFARINDQVLAASFARLGADAAVALGQISPAAKDAINSVAAIEAALFAAGASAKQTGQALEVALSAAFQKADTLAALDALTAKIKSLGAVGSLSAEAMTRLANASEAARRRIEDMTPGIQSVEEAFRSLGVTSKKELDRTADEAKKNFDFIRDSGKASTEELKAAFTVWAEKAVAANGGVADATLKAQASALGLAVEVDKTGKVIVQSMAESASGVKGADKALQDAAGSADKLGEAAGNAGKSMAEAAREHNAAIGSVTGTWMDATKAASRYAGEAREAVFSVQKSVEELRAGFAGYVSQMEALDARQQRLSSSAASGVESLRLRLVELNGTEEQIAQARKARDVAEVQRAIELMQIEMQRAQMRNEGTEAQRLQEEIRLLQTQLGLIEEVYRAESRSRSASTGGRSSGGGFSAGGAGVQATAPAAAGAKTTLNINLPPTGVLGYDRGALEGFARQLGPVITDLQRKGAL